MSQETYNQLVQTQIDQGVAPKEIAQSLRTTFPSITVPEASKALSIVTRNVMAGMKRPEPAGRQFTSPVGSLAAAITPSFAVEAGGVKDAAFQANLLLSSDPNMAPVLIVQQVKELYPDLTLADCARILKCEEPMVFPEMSAAVVAATLASPDLDSVLGPFGHAQLAATLHRPGVFPAIEAFDLARALGSPVMLKLSKFQRPNENTTTFALQSAGYSQAEVAIAIVRLYPPPPPLLAPAGLAVSYRSGKISARWDPVDHAKEYQVAISDAQGTPFIIPSIFYHDLTAKFPVSDPPAANYLVQVRALVVGMDQQLMFGPYCDPVTVITAPAPTKLVHSWSFHEHSGMDAQDAAGNSKAMLTRSVTREGQGPGGLRAVHLDGSNESFVDFGDVGQFGTNDFTVALWLKTRESSPRFDLIGNRTAGEHGNFFSLQMQSLSGQTGFVVCEIDEDASGRNYIKVVSLRPLNDGAWHHVAVVRVEETMWLFIDGACVHWGRSAGVTDIANGTSFKLGRSLVGMPDRFAPDGSFADVRIYNGAVGAADLKALFSCRGPSLTIFAGDRQSVRMLDKAGSVALFAPLQVLYQLGQGESREGVPVRFAVSDNPGKMRYSIGYSATHEGSAQEALICTDKAGFATLGGNSRFVCYATGTITVTASTPGLFVTFRLVVEPPL